jgi:hypothetical protein
MALLLAEALQVLPLLVGHVLVREVVPEGGPRRDGVALVHAGRRVQRAVAHGELAAQQVQVAAVGVALSHQRERLQP